jgi:hypothetical protein
VLAVKGSRRRLEEFLADYEPRYAAACAEFAEWDKGNSDDWTLAHDRKMDELTVRHRVCPPFFPDTTFQIIEAWEVR